MTANSKKQHSFFDHLRYGQYESFLSGSRQASAARFASLLLASASLTACSDAGWEGYGPAGDGSIGSAYGYQEDRLGNKTWQVNYTGAIAFEALSGARQRAKELCSGLGLAGVDFKPEVAATDGIITASGIATCSGAVSEQPLTGTAALEEKRDGLQAEIEAQEQQLADARSSAWTGPIMAAGVQMLAPTMEREISDLRRQLNQVERDLRDAKQAERAKTRSSVQTASIKQSGSHVGNAPSGATGGDVPARCGFEDLAAVREDYNAEVDVQKRGGQTEPSLLDSFDAASERARNEAVQAFQESGESAKEFIRLSELQIDALFQTRDQALSGANNLGSAGTIADCSPNAKSASGAMTCLASSTFMAAVQVAFYCDEIAKKARNGEL